MQRNKPQTVSPFLLAIPAVAPIVWGSSFFIATEFLPFDMPLTVAMIRASVAGILLFLWAPILPKGHWWWRSVILGALNFSIFWALLFIAAYRLPGGIAATIGSFQPLIVLGLSWAVLNTRIERKSVVAAIGGIIGIAILLNDGLSTLDVFGVLAAVGGAIAMASGIILTKAWTPPDSVSLPTFASWQLIAGGILLLPFALWLEANTPHLEARHILALLYLAVPGAALSYLAWFWGVKNLGPDRIIQTGLLSPVVAILLGWLFLGQSLNNQQILGVLITLASIWISQIPTKRRRLSAPHLTQPNNG
ncbi:ABC transporter permease [Kordiimonas sediminis]|uniref:ABC transporter permease n=1 Tax=Kordiimonas sediminis TaxID=1735581 RepID=A0A919AQY8_9PROT|nr:EamA family transporter [Kordiimonas sediminis]GHF21218.1 ABC transporter permease [Kordiimonas sediminis]